MCDISYRTNNTTPYAPPPSSPPSSPLPLRKYHYKKYITKYISTLQKGIVQSNLLFSANWSTFTWFFRTRRTVGSNIYSMQALTFPPTRKQIICFSGSTLTAYFCNNVKATKNKMRDRPIHLYRFLKVCGGGELGGRARFTARRRPAHLVIPLVKGSRA